MTRSAPLSNDVLVSGPAESNGHTGTPDEGAGVLANLPRTRPQRATARRAAARDQRGARAPRNGAGADTAVAEKPAARAPKAATGAKPKSKPKAKAKKPAPAVKRAPRQTSAPREEVPRQGFECIEERATGSVPPPGGPELIGTAAEIVGELAKAGVAGGERLLRDVLSRLGR